MAFPPPYGTASSSTHHDPHPHFASDDGHPTFRDDGQAYWHGNDAAFSSYRGPSRPSSSSSLAGALDEAASKVVHRQPVATHSFPESEVVPRATPLPFSLATAHFATGPDIPYYLDAPMLQPYQQVSSPDEYWSDELMSTEALSPQDPLHSPYAMYEPAPHHEASELGCMNGQLMQTGIIGNPCLTDGVPLPALRQPFHAPLPPSAVGSRSRFPLTRSYTLEGAVTPIEPRTSPRAIKDTAQTPPPPPVAASPDATSTDSAPAPAAPRRKKKAAAPGAPSPALGSVPSTPMLGQPLFTKFPTKQPFRNVHAPAPPPGSAGGSRADGGAGARESVVEDVKGPVHPPPAKKKPAMACLFCRERKICCGPPAPDSADPRCKQCVKRDQTCVFPTECRRGQHKRTPRKATIQALTEASAAAAAAAASPAGMGGDAGCSTAQGMVLPTQTEKAAAAPKRARSSDAQAQAGDPRSASLARSRPQSPCFGPLSSAV